MIAEVFLLGDDEILQSSLNVTDRCFGIQLMGRIWPRHIVHNRRWKLDRDHIALRMYRSTHESGCEYDWQSAFHRTPATTCDSTVPAELLTRTVAIPSPRIKFDVHTLYRLNSLSRSGKRIRASTMRVTMKRRPRHQCSAPAREGCCIPRAER